MDIILNVKKLYKKISVQLLIFFIKNIVDISPHKFWLICIFADMSIANSSTWKSLEDTIVCLFWRTPPAVSLCDCVSWIILFSYLLFFFFWDRAFLSCPDFLKSSHTLGKSTLRVVWKRELGWLEGSLSR